MACLEAYCTRLKMRHARRCVCILTGLFLERDVLSFCLKRQAAAEHSQHMTSALGHH